MQVLSSLKSQTLEVLKYIIDGDESHLEAVKEHEKTLLENYELRVYDPAVPENFLRMQEKEFEGLCLIMEDNGISDPKNKTVVEWFHAIEFLEEKARSNKPTGNTSGPQGRSKKPGVK